jgi:ribosomal protein L11 methyltransferase
VERREDVQGRRELFREAQERIPLRRLVVAGGEPELAQLLELFPAGVEQVDGGFAVYVGDESGEQRLREGFDVVDAGAVAAGWEDGWRAFHHGVVVGRFWVGPPWEEPPPNVQAIVIDPGRAFGTGAHPTTRLTLELLQEQRPGSLLDVGCGSGVLAIAAAKLGFKPVDALDVDPAAVEVARENALVNGVEIDASEGDALDDDRAAADVTVANVALDVVEALLPRLGSGRAVTSGYLDRDEPHTTGWRRVERRSSGGWAADLLERT